MNEQKHRTSLTAEIAGARRTAVRQATSHLTDSQTYVALEEATFEQQSINQTVIAYLIARDWRRRWLQYSRTHALC